MSFIESSFLSIFPSRHFPPFLSPYKSVYDCMSSLGISNISNRQKLYFFLLFTSPPLPQPPPPISCSQHRNSPSLNPLASTRTPSRRRRNSGEHQVSHPPSTLCGSRGVWLSDFLPFFLNLEKVEGYFHLVFLPSFLRGLKGITIAFSNPAVFFILREL